MARGGRLGVLGNRDIMNAPFSITSYTSKMIEDQQATTAADVAKNDPSVRFTGQTGGILDAYYIRGFPVAEGNSGEVALDGIFGVAPNYRVFTDYVERIEVLKGPTAFLYGMSPSSSIGGTINIVPKRAGDVDLVRFTADYIGSLQGGGHLDWSRRFGKDREFGLRLNGSYRGGDTPIDKQSTGAFVGSLGLDYRGERFRASVDLLAQEESFIAPSRPFLVAAGIAVPPAPDGHRNVTQAWETSKIADQGLLFRAEYDVTDQITVFADLGGAHTRVDRVFGTPTITNWAGDTINTPANFIFQINRYTYDAGIRASFDTSIVKHTLAFQALGYRDDLSRGSTNGRSMTSNIYVPIDRTAQSIATPTFIPKISQTDLMGFALSDTLSMLDDRIQLMLGGRHQRITSDNFSPTTGQLTSSYDKSALTPMVGVVLKPWRNVSLYGNYIQGLSKGDVAPSTATNAGEALAPYVAKQYEVGIKVDFGRIAATVAAFQIEKPFGQLVGNVFTAGGQQRNRGLEFSVFGEITPELRVLAGTTLLDASLTQTNTPGTLGNRPIGVAAVQANVGIEWDTPFVSGLTLSAGVSYSSDAYVDTANTQSIPAWTRVDFGARYRTTIVDRPVTFRAAVQNAFDANYWGAVTSYGALVQGAPRTALLSASVDF
ncbi:MAG: TonB-dependent siderophore receptor [Proteobacteria bacterium]|nr:TonB-dependent siderophore receptor [Pseudomonadota bacterium]